jgi:two-component system cell cycle sensor histidine kinase/response regulator CckA
VKQNQFNSAQRHEALVRALGEIVYEWRVPTDERIWDGDFTGVLGYSAAEMGSDSESWRSRVHPDDLAAALAEVNQATHQKRLYDLEYRFRHRDGHYLWMHDRGVLFLDAGGKLERMVGVFRNVTPRKEAERESYLLTQALRSIHDCVVITDLQDKILFVNEPFCRTYGYAPEELINHSIDLVRSSKNPPELTNSILPTTLQGGWQGELINRRKNGEDFPIKLSSGLIRGPDGQPRALIGVANDITERKRMELALKESEERFRQLAENIGEVFWLTDPDKNRIVYISPAYEAIWGRSCQSLYDAPRNWIEAIHAEDRDRILQAALTKQVTGGYDEEYRIIRADGATRWIRDRAFPVRDAQGRVYRVAGIAEDVTEKRQLELQLRQSQKMDSIGQLAGGVAHDFNNILTIILGHASLLPSMRGTTPEAAESAREIIDGAQRAANLTRQLLAFSRKQVMQPRDLNLNDIVTHFSRMLHRILGEDIALQFDPAPHLPLVHADVPMIEQILMNLAVNARDAMPRGGALRIKTVAETIGAEEARKKPDAAPGDYVRLSVTDTGCGIPPENLPHLFEPFFTTKEVGQGTGLGLATVYGIVTQHNGWVEADSQVGHGATFHIHLPALQKHATAPIPVPAENQVTGGSETILLVEDEDALRPLARTALQRFGYHVLEAANGVDALKHWTAHRTQIQLLVTDIVLPEGITGLELADKLHAERPALTVLFTSGYSADFFSPNAVLQKGVNFLQKPYRMDELARTVRACLDAKSFP